MPPSSLSKNGGRNQEEPFHVGFETPVVIDVQDPALLSSGGNNSGSDGGGRLGREGEGGGCAMVNGEGNAACLYSVIRS